MKQYCLIIIFICAGLSSVAQAGSFQPVERMSWHQLGNKKIAIRVSSYGPVKKNVMINLHHNETTSLQAAQNVLLVNGGILINIENDNERLISFDMNGRTFRFDPNRIFTETGIRKTLAKLNRNITPAAIKTVRRFAGIIRSKIPAGTRTVIAVHNNEEGDLSISSYIPGGDLQKEAQFVHRSGKHDEDDFFLTTSPALFRKLKTGGYNVVLQHNKKATDDGSLSIYYGRNKKTYVNVEAELGRLEDQQAMLNNLLALLKN